MNVVIAAWTNDVSVVVVPQSEEDPPSEVSSCCRRRVRSSPSASPRGSTRMALPVALQITSSCLSPTTMPSTAKARRGRADVTRHCCRSISSTSGRLGDDADGEMFEETSRASPSCFIIKCRGVGGGGGVLDDAAAVGGDGVILIQQLYGQP